MAQEGKWFSLRTPAIPAELQAIQQTISGAFAGARQFLETARGFAAVNIPALSSSPGRAAADAVLQIAVRSLRETVTGLLDDGGVYVLVVPIPKKGLFAVPPSKTPGEAGSESTNFPLSMLLQDLQTAVPTVGTGFRTPQIDAPAPGASLRSSKLFQQAFDPDAVFSGGNAYFFKTVAESLFDPEDDGRPRFTRESYWTYGALVAGSTDIASILSAATFFGRLFGRSGKDATGLDATRGRAGAIAQHLHAEPTERSLGVVLTWDVVPEQVLLDEEDGTVLRAVEWAVLRSTHFRARFAQHVADIFPSRNLSEGASGSYGARVVGQGLYDGNRTRFRDDSAEIGVEYVYHVAFRWRAERKDASGRVVFTQLPWDALSGHTAIKLDPASSRSLSRGRPPNWWRTPSVARLFPPVERVLDLVLTEVAAFEHDLEGAAGQVQAYLAMLDREVAKILQKGDQFTKYLDLLNGTLLAPTAGISARFAYGQGAASSFLQDLGTSLANNNDPDRPAFDNGDEYVTGIILLAAGPDPTKITKVYDLLRALFGESNETDPVLEGLQSVATRAAEVEATLLRDLAPPGAEPAPAFSADMTPAAQDAACSPAVLPVPSLDPHLNPRS